MKGFAAILIFCAAAIGSRAAEKEIAPPLPPSPIEQFRTLLDLPESQRMTVLATRSPQSRQTIEAKIKEYRALPAQERDRRLNVMDIHWHLKPLMAMAKANRTTALARVPAKIKPVVEDRLERWDKLAAKVKQDVLTNETAMSFLIAPPQPPITPPMPRVKFDREEVARALQGFANLSPEQRQQCVDSFAALAGMAAEERNHFLKNAERWQEMTEKERDAWREIVNVRPPSPPGMDAPNAPMPGLGR